MSELSRDEFLLHMQLIRQDIAGVDNRLDVLNGRTRIAENAIAVLEDRSNEGKAAGIKWGAVSGVSVSGALWAVWEFLIKPR